MSSDSPDAAKNFSRTPTSWDALDDVLLMHLKDNQKLGWKEIASHFHNRTPNACQFRWRRLKLGNLKNPPKSAQALGGLAAAAVAATADEPAPPKKPQKRRKLELLPGIASVYSPLANTTFTGYDTVQTALAGLNALLLTGGASPSGAINTTLHPQTFDNLPKLDVVLDVQTHSAAAAGAGGGYFTDINVDPTLNLPHNKLHPAPSLLDLTPRTLNADQHPVAMHSNSIIQIVRDDRALVLLQRHSVLSLPSKLMHIPHHNSNTLAHLPVLFGGSILGPAGSVLGPAGLPQLALTLLSIRNGSIVGPAYLRRLSMLVLQGERRMSERERIVEEAKEPRSELATPSRTPAVLELPWLMEEDELLINRRRKELSFAELSILLPQRTEGEIWARIDALERLKNGPRGQRRRRQLLLGLDDDFYDDVDSVIGGIDSDDDDVLLDVDDGLLRRARKRRASSAVNPLTVRESIKRRFH